MDFEIEGEDDAYNFDMWKKPSKSKNFFSGGDEDAVYNYDFRGDVADPIYALDSPVVSKKKTEQKAKPVAQPSKSSNDASNILDKAKSLMSKYSNPVRASVPAKPSTFDDFDEDDISVESSGSLPRTLTRTSDATIKDKQLQHKASKSSYTFDDSPEPTRMTSAMDLENDDISDTSMPREASVYSVDKSQLSGNDSYSNDDFENGEDSVLSDSAVVELHHTHHHHKPTYVPAAPPAAIVNDEPEKLNLHTIADLLGDAGWDPSEDVHESYIEESIPDIVPPAPQPQAKYGLSRESSAVSEKPVPAAMVPSVPSPLTEETPSQPPLRNITENQMPVATTHHQEPVVPSSAQPSIPPPAQTAVQPATLQRQISPPIAVPKPSDSISYPPAAAPVAAPAVVAKKQQSNEFVQQFQKAVQSETMKHSQPSPPQPQQQPIYTTAPPPPDHQSPLQPPPPQPPASYPMPPYYAAPQQPPYAPPQQNLYSTHPQQSYQYPPAYPPYQPYPPYPYMPPMHQSFPPPQYPYPYPNYMDLARSMPTFQPRTEPNVEYEKKIEALMSELTFAKEEAAFATRKLADVIMNLHQYEAKSTVSTSTDDLPKTAREKEKKILKHTSSSNSFEEYEDDFEESHIAPSVTTPPKSSRHTKSAEKHEKEKPRLNIPVEEVPKRIASESPRFHVTSSRSSDYLPRRSVRYDVDTHRDSASALLFTSQEIFRRQLDTLRSKLDMMNASRHELRNEYRPTSMMHSVSTLDDLKKSFEYRRKTTQAKLKDALLQADPSLSIHEVNNLLAKYG